jgi:hypothetical protein
MGGSLTLTEYTAYECGVLCRLLGLLPFDPSTRRSRPDEHDVEGRFGSIADTQGEIARCPLYPQEHTFLLGMSANGHFNRDMAW